jgi:hypothetical protein
MFTRGTVIPLHLTLTCADADVRGVLVPAVRLLRHVTHDPPSAAKVRLGGFDAAGRSRPPGAKRGVARAMTNVDFNMTTAAIGDDAVFWLVSGVR